MCPVSRRHASSQSSFHASKTQYNLPDGYGLYLSRHEGCLKVLFQRRDWNRNDLRLFRLLLLDPNANVSTSLAELVASVIAIVVSTERSDLVAVGIIVTGRCDENSRAASVGSDVVVELVSCVFEVSERHDGRLGGAPGAVRGRGAIVAVNGVGWHGG
jgi:hypothetical protein